MEAKIIEWGNNWPVVGDLIAHDCAVYRITAMHHTIHTRPGRSSYVWGEVEEAPEGGDTFRATLEMVDEGGA